MQRGCGVFVAVRRCLVGLCAGVLVAWGTAALAQFDLEVEQRLLIDLLRDGKYKQALTETRRVEKVVKPTKKNPVPGPGTKIYIDLLIYQGTLERRMGSLDAAEKSLGEAFKLINDPAYQQFLARGVPEDEKDRGTYLLMTELAYLQLLDSATELFLDRIRAANERRLLPPPSAGATPAPPAVETPPADGQAGAAPTDDREQIVGWFRRVDDLIRWSQGVRGGLRGKFPEADKAAKQDLPPAEARLALSPQARAVASLAPPYRFVGMRYLEASKLPWTLSFDAETPADDTARRPGAAAEPNDETEEERQSQAASQRLRAKAYLERSIAFADDAIAPVMAVVAADEAKDREDGKIDAEIRLAARQEEARIRAERLVPLADVALRDDDLPAARTAIDEALGALREAERPNHPDLARPLIVSAEVAFAASRRSLEEQDAATARDQSQLAVESLQEARLMLNAKDSAFDREAPIHALLAGQLLVAESFAKSSTQSAAATSAADAAARRALAAIKAAPRPKTAAPTPAQPPATPPAAGAKPGAPPAVVPPQGPAVRSRP